MRSLQPLTAADAAELVCPWCGRRPDRAAGGFQAVRDGQTIGAVVLAPAQPERELCPPGASVIEALWVAPADLREHIGTQLVQRACARLVAERARCLVAYAAQGRPDCSHLPAAWLAHAGFEEHVGGVQWRIDLRRTLPLVDLLKDAAALPARVLRPRRPQAAGRVQQTLNPS